MAAAKVKRGQARRYAKAAGLRSGFEHAIAKDLDARGIKYEYEPNTFVYEFPLRASKCSECGSKRVSRSSRYTPDFNCTPGGYIEAKGRLTSANRTRLAAYAKSVDLQGKGNPPIRILFASDNWLTKKHLARYSDWARKEGFEYSVGKTIPVSWTK